MKRLTHCLFPCAIFLAGCATSDKMAAWELNASPQQVRQEEPVTPPGERGTAPQSALARVDSLDSHIQAGQSEVAAWYQDQDERRLPRARMHFETVLSQDPRHLRAHHGLAIIADLEKNWTLAERHYQQALAQNPNDSDLLGDLGYSYFLQERFSESEQYSQRALQANPDNVKARRHLADALARQGKTGQAQEIYAQILPASEVQKALAENPPQTTLKSEKPESDSRPHLLDRLLPGRSQGERIADEIQKRQQARDTQPQMASAGANRPASTAFPPARPAEEEILRARLAQIDNEKAPQSGPLLIDNQTRQITRLPGGDAASSMSGQMGGTDIFSGMANGIPVTRDVNAGPQPIQHLSASTMQPEPGYPSSAMTMNGSPQAPPPVQPAGYQSGGLQAGRDENAENSQPLSANATQQPWRGHPAARIQQATHAALPQSAGAQQPVPSALNNRPQMAMSGTGPGSMAASNFSQQAPQQALQPGMPQNGPLAGRNPQQHMAALPQMPAQVPSTQRPGNLPANPQQAGFGNTPGFSSNAPVSPDMNSYDQASRMAARMGMGLPGDTSYPSYQQAVSAQAAGTMNYADANVPPPQRQWPEEQPSPHLSQSFQPNPTPVLPPAFTQGGQMPPNTVPMYVPEQYRAEHLYDPASIANSNIPQSSWNAMQGYEIERWNAGKQANQPVQDHWNQGPVNASVSPSAGSQYYYPQSQGMTYTPHPPALPDNQTPPAWPHAQPAIPEESVLNAQALQTGYQLFDPQQQQELQRQQQLQQQQQYSTAGVMQAENQTPMQSAPQSPAFQNSQISWPQTSGQTAPASQSAGQIPAPQRSSPGQKPPRPQGGAVLTTPPDYRNAQGTPAVSGLRSDENAMPVIRPQVR